MQAVGELLGISKENGIANALLTYSPINSPFEYNFAKKLREKILTDGHFLLNTYEALIKEVIAPMMVSEYKHSKYHHLENQTVLYQYPPTLRIFPSTNPPKSMGRLHTDYDYGHQDGEVNFWLPLVNANGGNATLWSESAPGSKDFEPLQLVYGEIQRFHAVSHMHGTYPNDTGQTRISLDFRVALACSFNHQYSHPKKVLKFKHEMRSYTVDSDS